MDGGFGFEYITQITIALKNYIDIGRERAYREIEDITEELDSNF